MHTLMGVVVDEAHCITQWGGEFRTSYAKLADLRSYISSDVPFLATSATLAPTALQQVREKLQIDPAKSFLVNLGNDRPNITPSVMKIKSQHDYDALLDLIATGVLDPSDLVKTIIFTNSIQKTHEILWFLRHHLSTSCGKYIANFHALRSAYAKRRVMQDFQTGDIKILIATEVAGMVGL